MILQKSPHWWSCLATSFAMVLEVPVRQLFEEVGHNGEEIVFPALEEPFCRRSHHPQEFVIPCLRRGYALMCVEVVPVLGAPSTTQIHTINFPEGNAVRLLRLMEEYKGVVAGESSNSIPHAIAWDGRLYFDCRSDQPCEDVDFNVREFFAFVPTKSKQGKNSS